MRSIKGFFQGFAHLVKLLCTVKEAIAEAEHIANSLKQTSLRIREVENLIMDEYETFLHTSGKAIESMQAQINELPCSTNCKRIDVLEKKVKKLYEVVKIEYHEREQG